MTYSFAPRVVFPTMNVTCLMYLSIINIAELYLSVKVDRASIKLIVIVWTGISGNMIDCYNLYCKCLGVT